MSETATSKTALESTLVINLEQYRQIFTFLGEEWPVTFKFTQEYPGFSFCGIEIPPATAGRKIKMPVFIANQLEQKNLGKKEVDFEITVNTIRDILTKEQTKGPLNELPPNFIPRCLAELADPNLPHYKRKIVDFNKLIQLRQKKILSKIGILTPREIQKSLSEPEFEFLTILTEFLTIWECALTFSED